MEKYKILATVFCFSILVTACSQSEPEVKTEKNNAPDKLEQSVNETMVDKKANLQRSTKDALLKKQKDVAKRTLSLNGEKFIYTGELLRKGSEVFNTNMSEKGVMKGTFVVISTAMEVEDGVFLEKIAIAKDTYRLVPENADDLVTIYKRLLSNKTIERVEIEVDYSGKINAAAEF